MTFRFKRGIKRIGDWVVSEGKNEIGRMLKILNLPMVNSSCFFSNLINRRDYQISYT